MMKMKKNYSSIGEWVKRNSVSFLVSDGVCMDIKVEPNTEEVDFGDLYGIRLNFDCNKKSFPSVKRLRFGESNELYIKFSNTLFPNVREIVSTNLKYPSGTMLIRKLNDAENLLLNTFCLEEDEPLDLRGITDIDEDALIGCKSNQVIHTEDIVNVSVKAFEKSGLACMKKPFVDGVKMAGTIACDFNKNAEKYIIPNFATAMATFLDYNMDATMIIKCNKAFFRRDMFYSVPNNLVFMGTDHMSEANVKYLKRYNAKISSTNPEYTTINDIVYTKDMRKVVSCFCHKIDDVTIEDGVEEIGNGAFIDCQITSVKIPESVKKIGDDAFRNCTKLTIIETPGALSELNDYVFYNCGALETVKINEGAKTIHEKAFIGASIKKLFIPASFGGFDKYGYINAQIIVFASDDIPDNIVERTAATKIITPSRTIYLPNRDSITKEIKDEINSLLNSQKTGFAEPLYKTFGKNPNLKRILAFHEYGVLPNEEIKKYLKRVGKALAKEFIDKNEAENLAKLIQYDVLPTRTLEQIPKAIDEIGYVDLLDVKKLILDKIGKS